MDFKGMYVFSDQGVIEKIILKCVIQKCDVNLIRRLGVDCNEAVRVIKQGKGGGVACVSLETSASPDRLYTTPYS